MQATETYQLNFQPTLPGLEAYTQKWYHVEVQGGVLAVKSCLDHESDTPIGDIEAKVLMFMDEVVTLPFGADDKTSSKQLSNSELYGIKASPGSICQENIHPLEAKRNDWMHVQSSPSDYVVYIATDVT